MSFGFYIGGITMTILAMTCLDNVDKGFPYVVGSIACLLAIIFLGWEEMKESESGNKTKEKKKMNNLPEFYYKEYFGKGDIGFFSFLISSFILFCFLGFFLNRWFFIISFVLGLSELMVSLLNMIFLGHTTEKRE